MLTMHSLTEPADRSETPSQSVSPEEWRSFAVELDATLRRIGAQRVRVSLACMMLPDGVADRFRLAAEIARRVSCASVLAGVDSDGAVLVASFGPRRFGPAGDAEEGRRLAGAFREALNELMPNAIGGVTVSVGHFWSDEWVGVASIACRTLLPQVTVHRLTRPQPELAVAS
jgi:hypothetical protein